MDRACPKYRYARSCERDFGAVPADAHAAGGVGVVCFEIYGASVRRDPMKGFIRVRFYVDDHRAIEVRMGEKLAAALMGGGE